MVAKSVRQDILKTNRGSLYPVMDLESDDVIKKYQYQTMSARLIPRYVCGTELCFFCL